MRDRPRHPPARRRSTIPRILATALLVLAGSGALLPAASGEVAAARADAPTDASPPNFPAPPAELERWLRAPFEIVDVEPIDEGRTGAIRMEIVPAGVARPLVVKWKAAPAGGDGWNRSPRREVAAYEIQKWFLDPADFVVPPTAVLCIPLDAYAAVDESPQPNLPGASCVLGTIAAWLDDVRTPDPLLDVARFEREPRYAMHLARYNLLTHLIDNRDTRAGNQVASDDADDRRVYSVDNGISFGEWLHNPFRSHWNVIRVPALPRAAVERLGRIDDRRAERLAVVAELRRGTDGVFRESTPGEPLPGGEGMRLDGDVLQIGLTSTEIAGIRRRIRTLLAAVDDGEIRLLD